MPRERRRLLSRQWFSRSARRRGVLVPCPRRWSCVVVTANWGAHTREEAGARTQGRVADDYRGGQIRAVGCPGRTLVHAGRYTACCKYTKDDDAPSKLSGILWWRVTRVEICVA